MTEQVDSNTETAAETQDEEAVEPSAEEVTENSIDESTEDSNEDEEQPESNPWDTPEDAKAYIDSLRKENKDWRQKYQSVKKPLEQQIAEAETEKSSLAVENARLKVALNKDMPLEVVESVGGSTVEEIESKLDALIAWKNADKPSGPRKKPVAELKSATADDDTERRITDPREMAKYLANQNR